MKNIVLCGIGGQGTILASKLIAAAAMKKGIPVMSAETIGMAQRGGSVFSHLRLGEGIQSPMIAKGSADIIIGFEPGETVRMMPYLKENGTVVTSLHAVKPVTASLTGADYNAQTMTDYIAKCTDNAVFVDTEYACGILGNHKIVNVLLLGCAAETGELGLSKTDIEEAIKDKIPEKLIDLNMQALNFDFGGIKG